jgi:hypothetical protein
VLTAGTNIALAKGTGITGFNDIAAADVWAVGTRTLTAGAYSGLTAGDNDLIWDATMADHDGTGTTGLSLYNAGLAGDPWGVSLPGSYTGSEAGSYLPTLIKQSRGR